MSFPLEHFPYICKNYATELHAEDQNQPPANSKVPQPLRVKIEGKDRIGGGGKKREGPRGRGPSRKLETKKCGEC